MEKKCHAAESAVLRRSFDHESLIVLGFGFFFASQLRWRSAWRAELAREPEGRVGS